MRSERDAFTTALRDLKARSTLNYASLAKRVGRPVSTIHGWITGKHLPYARDNRDFERVLELLDADDVERRMETLFTLRDRAGLNETSGGDPSAAESGNPYLGLRPFSDADAAVFRGRHELTKHLVELVYERLAANNRAFDIPMTVARRPSQTVDGLTMSPLVVTGASGAGKTSVLRAGLQAALAPSPEIDVIYRTPSVARGAFLARPTDRSPDAAPYRLIILDDFEQLLAAGDATGADARLRQMCHHPEDVIVVGVRSDHLDRAIEMPTLRHGIEDGPVIVEAMRTEEATECIVGPAQHVGLIVDPELSVVLIAEFSRHAEAHGSTEALPLLSDVLYQLAENTDDGHLTLARYRRLGGLERAVERSAEAAFEALDERGRVECKELFSRLVRLGADALPTRRPLRFDELRSTAEDQDLYGAGDDGAETGHRAVDLDRVELVDQERTIDTVIDEFVSRRLLTLDVDTITISHETLLAAWPRLVDWVEEARHQLTVLRRIAGATATWEEVGRDPDALLRGTLLLDAEELLDAVGDAALTTAQREFVEASSAARRSQERRDDEILSDQLAMRAMMLRSIDASLGAQIALVAHDTAPTVATRSALLAATSPPPGPRHLGDPGPTMIATSADRSYVAVTNSVRGTVKLGRCDEPPCDRWIELACSSPQADAYAIALSPDGRLLAVGGTDRAVTLVDLKHPDLGELEIDDLGDSSATSAARRVTHPAVSVLADPALEFSGPVHALAFDSSGRHLYCAGAANGVGRWAIDIADDGVAGPTLHVALDALLPLPGTTLAVAPGDDELLACAGFDGSVSLLNTRTGRIEWRDDGDPDVAMGAVCRSADGRLLLAGSRGGEVGVWRVDAIDGSGQVTVRRSPTDGATFSSWVNAIAMSPSGRVAAAASSDGRVALRSTDTGRAVADDLQHPTVVTGVVLLDDRTVLTTAEDGTMRTFHIDVDAPVGGASIWSTSFDAGGDHLVTGSPSSIVVRTMHPPGAARPLTIEATLAPPDGLTLSSASSISPDGSMIVAGTRQGAVVAAHRNARGGWSPWEPIGSMPSLVEHVAYSADGRLIGVVDHSGCAQLWVRRSDRQLELAANAEVPPPALSIGFARDRRVFAVSSESSHVTLYGIDAIDRGPWHPDVLASVVTGASFALCVAFHPRLDVMAVSNADRSVSLWSIDDARAPTLITRLTGPGGHPMNVGFDASGSRLAAGTTDGWAWVWDTSDVTAPVEYARITTDGAPVYAVALTPDGGRLIGAGPRSRLDTWLLDEPEAIRVLEDSIGDPITEREWETYIPTIPFHAYQRRRP